MKNRKIAIIGCGNLGSTIVHGMLDDGFEAANLILTRRNTASLKALADKGVVITSDNSEAVKSADVVILGCKTVPMHFGTEVLLGILMKSP